jgi:hypothetical protein
MGCAAPNSLHWQDLRSRDQDYVLSREGVKLLPDGEGYGVRFLNSLYRVDPHAQVIAEIAPNPERIISEEFAILLIRYLVAPYGGPVTGKEISEKDLPGGVTFFRGPHELHVSPIVERFGKDPEAFEARGVELGAERMNHGDCSMRFFPFPAIPVTYVLWREDEEFPASVSVLFDGSVGRWFELDMVFTLVMVLTDRICEQAAR